jgi:hypothetical protein
MRRKEEKGGREGKERKRGEKERRETRKEGTAKERNGKKKEKRDSSLRSRPSVRKTDGRKKSAAALGMTGVGYRSRETQL